MGTEIIYIIFFVDFLVLIAFDQRAAELLVTLFIPGYTWMRLDTLGH